MQKRKLPLGFLIKITSTAIGEELTLINPLLRFSFKYFYSTQSLFQDILYRGLNLGYFPSLSIILQLYNQCSSSLLASFLKNTSSRLQYSTSTFIVGLVYFFGAKAFLISAIIIAKIVYLGFLASYANRVALIIQMSKVLSELRSSLVSYIVFYLGLGLVLDIELVLDLGSGSLSILFIVEYQFFQYFYILRLNFYLVQGGVVVRIVLYSLVGFLSPQQTLAEILYQWNLVKFLGRWNWVDFLGIGQILVGILDQQILVDFLDFSLKSKQRVIRYFCL